MDINWLFDNFQHTAFRVEALPFYASDTRKPGYQAFLKSAVLPEDHNQAWRSEVSEGAKLGRAYLRLRLFSDYLTDYEKYESASYILSAWQASKYAR